MTNYEKAQELLKKGIAKKHFTFDVTGCIVLDLGGVYAGFISPIDKYVDVASFGSHDFFGKIDLDKMFVLDVSNRERYVRPIKKWEDAE
nr:MAG TPA: hypothetical protein [Bacteriophage sp.]